MAITLSQTSVVCSINRTMQLSPVAIATLSGLVGDVPLPSDDTAPSVSLLSWRFGTAITDANSNTLQLDPYARVHIEPFKGIAIITNGVDLPVEYNGEYACDLEIKAPQSAPTVGVSGGSGLTGNYKVKYRYLASKTGKVSGFSPLSSEVSPSSQQIDVSSISVSSDGQVDRIQVFRSLTDDYTIFYLDTEVANSGTPTATLTSSDSTIQAKENDYLTLGRIFNEGRMWPVTRTTGHMGYLYSYGLRRMPVYNAGTCSVTNADATVTFTGGAKITYSRLMQKFTVSGDTTEYLIVDVDESNNTCEVYPAIDRSSDTGLTFSIEDNRDGRTIFISEQGKAGSNPTTHESTLGNDIGDINMLMFELAGVVHMISAKKIFSLQGDATEEPWESLVGRVEVEEGTVGPYSACLVPGYGLVYVESRLGPRVYDGSGSRFVGGDGKQLKIIDEWERFRAARRHEIVVWYDDTSGNVHFSYARDVESGLTREMVYNVGNDEWVGPWTRRVFSVGKLLDADAAPRRVLGSDLGAIYQDHLGSRDGYSSGTLTGTITNLSGRVVTDAAATFETSGEGNYGALVEFESQDESSYEYSVVVDNDATTFTCLCMPSNVAQGWNYRIAPIPWAVITGYLDGKDPHHMKTLDEFHIRTTSASAGSVRGGVAIEGGSFYESSSGEQSMAGRVHAQFRVHEGYRRGVLFQIMAFGSGVANEPEITQVMAYIIPHISQKPNE